MVLKYKLITDFNFMVLQIRIGQVMLTIEDL